ncbi:MAG: PKD domain-containing protein, partial [Chitinivibrionales bacterium]
TSKNPVHDYKKAGIFSVNLVVIGPGGKDSFPQLSYINITASIPKPKASFSGAPTTGTDSLKVQFIDSSTGTITSRLWTFGDNSTDTSKNPLHDYITTGSFSVKLVVSGPGGKDSVTKTNYITIISSIDTTTVVNTIQIKKITFDPVANAIKVFWTKDSAQSKNYTIGIYCSASGYPADTGVVKQIAPGNLPSDSASIALGKSIMFNTTYYVALWLKKGGGPWTVPIKDSIMTPSYTWQGVVYFRPDSVRDTAYAFNKRIRIVTDIPFDSMTDTLIAWPAPPDAAKNGFIPVSVGFYFKQQSAQSPYFYVGIACDSIPKKYSIASVRIYQYAGGCWTVEQSSGTDAVNNIVYVKTRDRADPFIAMIDAVPPAVTPSGKADGPALSNQPIADTVMVSDNICNMHCAFRYAKGANSYSEGDSVDTILNSKSDTLVFTVPGSVVSEDAGVRAMFIASDGANADTVDFSRQVIRGKQSDAVTTDALQWMPLHVTAMPDSPSARFALRNFAVNGAWKYDPKAFRMFRWFPCSLNVGATDKWVEYSDAQKDLFSFAPGNVFWLKTRQQSLIDFGSAETPSLITSFPATLQPNDWTDIAVPYKFNVIIGDILTATAAAGQPADSLQWYQWGLDTNKHYATKPVYVQGLSDINLDFGNTGDTLVSNPFVGYSVLNPYNRPVQLSIPPVPASMSAFGLPKKTAKKLARDGWAIRVLGRTRDGTPLCPVYCGYAPGKETRRDFFSAPPQLDNIAIRACDAKKNLFGHEIVRGALDEGGASFDLAVVNGSASLSAVEYGFETVNALPRGMQAMLVDLQTGALSSIEKPLVVSVNGGERFYLRLAVGGKEYLSKIKLEARLWRLGLLDAFPNPFGRQVRIRYPLPAAGIGLVKLSVIGVSGKTVFETTRAPGMAAGVQEFLWDGTDGRKNRVGTGVYVLRMTAFDEKAKIAGTFERKITCLP